MNLQVNCPFCQMLLSVDTRFGGSQMQCPSCQQLFVVPAVPVAQPVAMPAVARPPVPGVQRPGAPSPQSRPRTQAAPPTVQSGTSGGPMKVIMLGLTAVMVAGLIYGGMRMLDSAKKKQNDGMELSAAAKAREEERLKKMREFRAEQDAEKKALENDILEWIAKRIGDEDKKVAEELTRECKAVMAEMDKLWADADSNNDPQDLREFWIEKLGKRIRENKIVFHWLGGKPVSALTDALFGPNREFSRPRGEVADFLASGQYRGSGTGFFVSSDGLIMTNAHVVDDAQEIDYRGTDGVIRKANVLKADRDADIAILRTKDGAARTWLPLDVTESRMGAGVFTIGFPNASIQGVEPKFTDGRVSSLSGIRDDKDRYQISVPIQPGNSGGPLVDMKTGSVVGVIVAILRREIGADNVSYAVKSRVAAGVLSRVSGKTDPASGDAPRDLEAMAAKVRAATVMLLVK
jgi:serine protease Do